MAMTEAEITEWADRLLRVSMATRLNPDHQSLADLLVARVEADPEQAAYLIATLVQLNQ